MAIDHTALPAKAVGAAMHRLGRGVLDLMFPPLCIACRVPVSAPHNLCSECWSAVTFLDGPCCSLCGFPFDFDPGGETLCGACQAKPPAFDSARAAMRYDEKSRDLILALKRADRLDLVPALAKPLARAGRLFLEQADIITAVPLHRARLWERRFNQSAALARELGRISGKTADPLVIQRVRRTPSQGEMTSAKARRNNVRGAFRVPLPDAVRGKTVLLVDDVFTTGATIDACARVLKRAKAAKVVVLTLARVVRAVSSTI